MPIWPYNITGHAEKLKNECDQAEIVMKMIAEDDYNPYVEYLSSFTRCRATLIECFYSIRYELTFVPKERYENLVNRANEVLKTSRKVIDKIS